MAAIGDTIVELVEAGDVHDATVTSITRGDVRVTRSIIGNVVVLVGEDDIYDEFPDIPDDDILAITLYPCKDRPIPPVNFKYTYAPFPV